MMEPFVENRQGNGPALLYLNNWMTKFPQLSAGFTTRVGGVSEQEYDSLNCALHVDDQPQHVLENRKIIADTVGFPFEAWTCAEQVHGNTVHRVTAIDKGRGRQSRASAIQNMDALITDDYGIVLTSFYADCVPLYFFDPVSKSIGLAHAGWKGTVSAIATETIHAMYNEFGSRVEHIRAVVGPSIGACCYEVDEPVIKYVRAADMMHGTKAMANGRYRLDLKLLNRQIMIKAGIMPAHIEISEYCTACHPERFYSHRRDFGKTGRMMSWIGMEKE